MTAFLKIDECRQCHRSLPWEWVPAVLLNGKALAGTGVWRSQLQNSCCPSCICALEKQQEENRQVLARRSALIELLGGQRAYRNFTFERYQLTPGNRLAYERCRQFSPATENLYLWGPCGVGKTHLAWATARRCFEETMTVTILRTAHLTRRVRMKDPLQEQAVIDELVGSEVLVLDDLGTGSDTVFSRQLVQEVLDARDFRDRGGLLITTKYSLDDLAAKWMDDSVPSRVAGMCQIIGVQGPDRRVRS